jgi:hypothetical protein
MTVTLASGGQRLTEVFGVVPDRRTDGTRLPFRALGGRHHARS